MLKSLPNVKKTMGQIKRSGIGHKNSIHAGMHGLGKQLVRDSIQSIRQGPKTGTVSRVTISGRRVRHQASAPGEAPANRSGNLIKKHRYEVQGFRFMEFGNDAEYAKFLEVGTRKMKHRRFLLRSIQKNWRNALTYLRANVETF